MGWLFELHKTQPIAHAVGVLTFVCVLGMALGSVKFRGIGLGTAGVLFAGILVGHFGEALDHHTLDFVKEFGRILFVFTIGLQLGPGFFAALRQQGVKMNALAAVIVILGAVSAPLIGWLAGFDAAAVLGIFSGASTNTPLLGAGTQTLSTLPGIAPGRLESGVTISRVRHDDETHVATDATVIHCDDRLAVVGLRAGLDQFARVIGRHSDEDRVLADSALTFRRVVVTNRDVLGKSVGELNLDDRFGVAVTRVTRADLEMSAMPGLRLQFGDQVQIVGVPDDLDKAAAAVGNLLKELNETHFIPFFLGITLGVALGTLPIAFSGLPQPIKLGLAGGPLIVALILGRVGRIGRQVWHMPVNTNLTFREFGIALFFAAVGLGAGACVTVVPLMLIGIFARAVLKMNFMDLSGLVAGSMTDPPALAFASNIAGSDAPTVAYATVYPLTTLLRILSAQVLAIVSR